MDNGDRPLVRLVRSLSLNDKCSSKSLRDTMGITQPKGGEKDGSAAIKGSWVTPVWPPQQNDSLHQSSPTKGRRTSMGKDEGNRKGVKFGALSFMLRKRTPASPRGDP